MFPISHDIRLLKAAVLEYQKFGSETISAVPFIFGAPSLLTSNLDVARQVLSGQSQGQLKARHFDKSEVANRVLT
ncbi:hypothetical protein H0H81_011228, partial [Sphagnurus paluster]